MSAPRRPATEEPPAGSVPEDEYARAYSEGYGEGLREALKEILQHASRGHTASELRLLIESRLARVREDVELKRKSVLSPPRRPSWGAILRPPSPVVPAAPSPAPPSTAPAAGDAYLVREERPATGLRLVEASAGRFPRVLAISLRPPNLARVDPGRIQFVPVAAGDAPGAVVDPGRLAGTIRTAAEAPGGALVYFDAFETLATQAGVETMLKFVTWLTGKATETGSAVVVSVDPATVDGTTLSRLQRAFNHVL